MDRMTLDKMHGLLTKELNRIADKNTITPNELENAYKAFCLIEKIEERSGDGYSETGYHADTVRSPVTGRYVGRDRSYMHGNSGHSIKDRMISRLEHMMDETDSDYEKKEISEYIHKLEMSK